MRLGQVHLSPGIGVSIGPKDRPFLSNLERGPNNGIPTYRDEHSLVLVVPGVSQISEAVLFLFPLLKALDHPFLIGFLIRTTGHVSRVPRDQSVPDRPSISPLSFMDWRYSLLGEIGGSSLLAPSLSLSSTPWRYFKGVANLFRATHTAA